MNMNQVMQHGVRIPTQADQFERPRTGYFLAPDAIFDRQHALPPEKRLPCQELAVWLALWRHADRALTSFPSHATLATEAGQSVRRVRISLGRLIGEGHVQLRSGKRSGRSNVYTLVVPAQVHRRPAGQGRHVVPTPSARGADQAGTPRRPPSARGADEGISVKDAQGREGQHFLLSDEEREFFHSWMKAVRRCATPAEREKKVSEALSALRWKLKRSEHEVRALMLQEADT